MTRGRALPPRYFWLSALAMVCLHYAHPLERIIGYPYNLLGLLPVLVGLYVNTWCSSHFKRIGTAVKPFEQSTTLVVEGPFRYSRHPMYVGMVVALLGLLVILGSITPLIVIPGFVWLVNRRFLLPEERALEERFGEEYLRYKENVRRWI
jgi:protein-S-isoprenylcysteine O-methyltransferase Ste14